jgi:hypothetical protein
MFLRLPPGGPFLSVILCQTRQSFQPPQRSLVKPSSGPFRCAHHAVKRCADRAAGKAQRNEYRADAAVVSGIPAG